MASLSHALVAVMTATALGLGCNRTPPEEFPSSSAPAPKQSPSVEALPQANPSTTSTTTSSSTAAGPGRCVAPTSSSAPPPVAPGPAPGCPEDREKAPRKLAVLRVAFEESGAAVDAEFARGEHDTMRGLMFRKSMPEDSGMLFDLGERKEHDFWMHNTCIPLDMIFVDEDGFVVGIVENAPTLNDESRGVGCASRYVLEVNAGWSRRHGVRAGQHMKIPPEAR
jgi:uncharacterized membrane protein (UPF0127 family)